MGVKALLLSAMLGLAHGLASTDTITWGGDNSRTGYQTNHNMDPAIVGSSQFDQLWRISLPGSYMGSKEQAFSQPLVYTPSGDSRQYVYYSTTQNNVYKLDAKTGEIVASRNLHIPFLTADLNNCLDINPHVGIISTGVIDPDTNTLYLTAKTYANQALKEVPQGRPAGRIFIHALDANDLSERPNFPIDLEGIVARNAPQRVFNGGILNQRPALLHVGKFIYIGFGSHCVQYDFTGWLVGIDKTTGQIVEKFATQGADVPVTKKGSSIWMSGGGLASDNAGSIFFATGNGYASQLATIPVKGFEPPTALEEAAVHMAMKEDGSVEVVDFFMPYEKQELDGADKDLGTSPLQILPNEFSCGSVKRIGVVTGKSGKTYWLNLDDLGGYRNGENRLDRVLQVYQNENSVYAGAGVYPLEGGYVYINVIQFPSHVFKFSCNNGVPNFAKVADSPQKNAYVLGVSHGTVTSLDGQPGTGLVWVTDVQVTAGDTPQSTVRIYDAIPKDGQMVLRRSFLVPGIIKFTRAVFGDGIMYVGSNQGYLYAFGAPTKSPLDCGTTNAPVSFGAVDIKSTSEEKTVTCKALIATSVTGIELDKAEDYTLTNTPNTPLQLAVGAQFTVKATFSPGSVGTLSDNILVNTTNSVAGYRTSSSVRLTGSGSSADALLAVTPTNVSFTGVVSGPEPNGLTESVILSNEGNSELSIQSVQFSTAGPSGPFTAGSGTGTLTFSKFTIGGVPSTIAANGNAVLTVKFDSSESGSSSIWVKVTSNGGARTFAVSGTAGPAAVALLEFQTPDGSDWVKYNPDVPFDFGNVTENTYRSLLFRVTNNAASGGVKLSLTVSKPPVGTNSIVRAANQVDLAEGTLLAPGEKATAVMTCTVPKSQWNVEPYNATTTWTMNTNDPAFQKQVIGFYCNAVSEQAAPLLPNGLGKYRYVGCFKDNTPNRQLSNQLYSNAKNTNAMAIAACADRGATWCGTQYHSEAWAGNLIPSVKVAESNCNFDCSGDINQICGGNGVNEGAGGTYISLFADITQWDGNLTRPDGGAGGGAVQPPAGGPVANPGVNGYTHIGCYTEATQGRALPTLAKAEKRTVASCISACKALGLPVGGVEYASECWCGKALAASSVPAPLKECNTPCTDNTTETCGGGSRLNVYQLDSTLPSSSTSSGSSVSTLSSSGTPASTLSATVSVSTVTASTISSAAPTYTGPPRVRQTVGNYQFQGCYTETKNGRALSKKSFVDNAMTLEMCAAFCEGSTWMATEYGVECYCGDSLRDGSVPAQDQSDCSFLCPGDAFTFCGAGDRLQLYKVGLSSTATSPTQSVSATTVSASATTSTASTISTTSSTTTSTTSSAKPTSTAPSVRQVVNGEWSFQGCYTETKNGRALSGKTFADDAMTLERCAAFCKDTGATLAGIEYGRECYCSNSLREGSILAEKQSDCSFLCPGDKTTYCGAGDRLQLYKLGVQSVSSVSTASSSSASTSSTSSASSVTSSSSATTTSSSLTSLTSTTATGTTTSTVPTPTGPSIRQIVNDQWAYQGCYTDDSSKGRALTKKMMSDNAMTPEMCASFCEGSAVMGLQYFTECWCGDQLENDSKLAANQNDCSSLCAGDKTTYCGGGVRLQLYKRGVLTSTAESSTSSLLSTSALSGTSTSAPTTTSLAGTSTTSTSSPPDSASSFSSTATTPSSLSNTDSSTSSVSALTGSTSASATSTSSAISSSSTASTTSSVHTVSTSSTSSKPTDTTSSSSSSTAQSTSSVTSSSATSSATTSSATTSSATTSSATTSSATTSSATTSSTTSSASTSTVSPLTTSTRTSTTSTASATPTGPIIWPGNSNFTYYGCVAEPSKGRLLPKQVWNDGTNMTAKACAERCSSFNYAGLEYKQECWCGNELNLLGNTGAVPGRNVTDSECKLLCPGDNKMYCGAGSRMTLYINKSQL